MFQVRLAARVQKDDRFQINIEGPVQVNGSKKAECINAKESMMKSLIQQSKGSAASTTTYNIGAPVI